MEYNPNIAHIIAEDGTVFQVLNADGTEWDEEATRLLLTSKQVK